MPIGVPKVPFRNPGDEDASWVDIYNRLYRQRFLFLVQEIDSEIANQIVGLLVYLNIEDGTKDIFLYINSPGGDVISGVSIYDMMQTVRPDVSTICIGLAASMGSFILAGGAITRRAAFPHARVMIHQPRTSFFESHAGELLLEMKEALKLREHIAEIYSQRTGNPTWIISRDMDRDVFFSARQARIYGIIDDIDFSDDEEFLRG
uniref:ATP-dependent Clp protease proteolytic subunit n=1 Tax=Ipomoea pes-caprae TaxID=89656 RepID=U3R3N4_IPOPC|nr:clp protease proteolytic subunit [Ipomoea pes-caprae]AGW97805.1 clp protease proteolytic subunit [Ipomoea pes-caprae]QTZ17790.1 clp protease proteolytic subunit [Ipomoea pes-caprae]UKO32455.1 clp protease proteolytic subunit [Ipomoea pes-caprae]UTQ74936.1 clp protease proteolytic subunit [Ipomoea pes-caprae]BDR62594.1 ATP-dependent Clp protease proteolytic subunit [Ipomoea pes-caprae]